MSSRDPCVDLRQDRRPREVHFLCPNRMARPNGKHTARQRAGHGVICQPIAHDVSPGNRDALLAYGLGDLPQLDHSSDQIGDRNLATNPWQMRDSTPRAKSTNAIRRACSTPIYTGTLSVLKFVVLVVAQRSP